MNASIPDKLAAIKARADAATPGEWTSDTSYKVFARYSVDTEMTDDPHNITYDVHRMENADFIAHARQDIPALIAEVERLRAICEKALQDLPDSWKVLLEANDPERSTL